MHYYSFNIGDYTSHTAHLSPVEDIAYRRLLDLYYQTETPITNDIKAVCRQIRMRDHAEEVQQMLSEFFTLTDAGWTSARCSREIDDYHSKADKARANGKLGGRPKKQSESENNQAGFSSLGLANPDITQAKANQEPITINQEPRTSYSVTEVTGGQAAKVTDPQEIIFGYGVPYLVNAGTQDKQARSFLGKLRKMHGDAEVIDKLRSCMREKPLQPLEWLAAALPPLGVGKKLNKQEALEASNRAIGDEWAAEMMAKINGGCDAN